MSTLAVQIASSSGLPNVQRCQTISGRLAQEAAKKDNQLPKRRTEDPEHSPPPRSDQKVILVVDDEVMIRNVARAVLEREGYFILAAHDGEEALYLSRKFPGTIHAVLSDVIMPKMDGMQLRDRILKERPGTQVLLMSGHVDAPPPSHVPFLAKPFGPAVLKDRIGKLIASGASI